MHAEITINGSADPVARYVGWAPVPAQVRLANSAGAGPVAVTLRSRNTATGGQVEFYAAIPGTGQAELSLTLPAAGTPVDIFIAGKWGRPSSDDGDVAVDVIESATDQVIGSIPLMVRIRKDAMAMTNAERNRFRNAFARFNIDERYNDFRAAHVEISDFEMHKDAGFLPWHRAFLLDLERELQGIDPSVAIPYWQWDRPAPAVFSPHFMGFTSQDPSATPAVRFSLTNPFQFWVTEGVPGIDRVSLFDTLTEKASSAIFGPIHTEAETLDLGEPGALYAQFRTMEGNPHGGGHASFARGPSFVENPFTAPRDPLFFLLHANVDRLWAKWQWIKHRFDVTHPGTFEPADPPRRVGHNLEDTMWPWNGVTELPRPPTAPGGTLAPSPLTNAPGPCPRVRDVIDYQGVHAPPDRLGYDYDDVPFQFV
ncbi:MAG TPA: tyrosinase family protein [Pseudonocardiaceae bacterium]|nr:tyrosinase family protein [Pseudonocardiaceae bacterium]